MSGVQIRKYQEEDAESVKEVFTLGMSEHIPSSFVHVLKQPLTQMVLMCTFCALITSSNSYLLPFLAVALLLAVARLGIVYMFNRYIEATLSSDLRDVTTSYLRSPDSCFWVAESEGRVVGTVACLPAENAPGCLELKRMSVRRSHRGRGIAKALCRTVEDFTRDRGYAAVVLHTSMVQTEAQKLYEHMGFKRIREFVLPEAAAKILNFMLYEYRLDVCEEGGQRWPNDE
ncbi:probable N-acetyltransferase CML1 [Oryzias latipes]|uniref:probable N-acetyltransferase CML1 n=1 Tax=Oryzias latipes TaxID=8090 RepID=UPI0002A478B9|nr:probable N-acetyltransferase CML1 [Oryzias latipes]XP_011489088.1 probable N-acetyltransferase CML1 [Oryzias latipes]XP_011489089.1 probable N-acetyltransferase CML1 [Oryzias latipes]